VSDAARLSFAFAKRHGVLVRAAEGEEVLLTCREGADPRGIAEVRRHLGRRLKLERVPADTFEAMLQKAYEAGTEAAMEAAEGLEGDTNLTLLAEEFVASDYDYRHIIRCICATSAYQRSSRSVKGDESDQNLFSHMPARVVK